MQDFSDNLSYSLPRFVPASSLIPVPSLSHSGYYPVLSHDSPPSDISTFTTIPLSLQTHYNTSSTAHSIHQTNTYYYSSHVSSPSHTFSPHSSPPPSHSDIHSSFKPSDITDSSSSSLIQDPTSCHSHVENTPLSLFSSHPPSPSALESSSEQVVSIESLSATESPPGAIDPPKIDSSPQRSSCGDISSADQNQVKFFM